MVLSSRKWEDILKLIKKQVVFEELEKTIKNQSKNVKIKLIRVHTRSLYEKAKLITNVEYRQIIGSVEREKSIIFNLVLLN